MPIEWGEEVYLCGPREAFGVGDPSDALGPLSAADYPAWRMTVDLPRHTYVEFRWVKKRDGRVVAWSPHRYAMRAGTVLEIRDLLPHTENIV